jgi:uncharacterized protein YciI
MATFALILVHGPGWDTSRPIREQRGWDEHAAFMDGLVAEGFIVVGGPLGAGDRTLHLVEAGDEVEIRARMAVDPWAKAGLLVVGSVETWALWLDGRRSLIVTRLGILRAGLPAYHRYIQAQGQGVYEDKETHVQKSEVCRRRRRNDDGRSHDGHGFQRLRRGRARPELRRLPFITGRSARSPAQGG